MILILVFLFSSGGAPNLKQNEAQGTPAESTHKEANQYVKDVIQAQQ